MADERDARKDWRFTIMAIAACVTAAIMALLLALNLGDRIAANRATEAESMAKLKHASDILDATKKRIAADAAAIAKRDADIQSLHQNKSEAADIPNVSDVLISILDQDRTVWESPDRFAADLASKLDGETFLYMPQKLEPTHYYRVKNANNTDFSTQRYGVTISIDYPPTVYDHVAFLGNHITAVVGKCKNVHLVSDKGDRQPTISIELADPHIIDE